mmetsp:Transcript_13530/g.38483  ORF Transcript_13530/g.38483 Transcript_13530/m.38483 type:complete len:85 (-) Transcript_13530:494-748(-)
MRSRAGHVPPELLVCGASDSPCLHGRPQAGGIQAGTPCAPAAPEREQAGGRCGRKGSDCQHDPRYEKAGAPVAAPCADALAATA